MPDAVVIGSGPNGLVAANMLADKGWSVSVFEAASEPGGAVRSSELIEPGFVNDLFSAFYPLAAASHAITDLDLEEHGLRWRRSPYALAHPGPDGTCPIVSMNLDDTCSSLDKLAPGDGDAWRRLYKTFDRVRDGLVGTLFDPFPPVKAALKVGVSMRPGELLRFTRFAVLPVRRLVEEEFTSESARRLMAGNALHADFAPETAMSGFFGWFLMALAQWVGFPVPEGGAGELSNAMVRRLESRHGTVTCNASVIEVIVRGRRAVGVRLADGTEVDATRAVIADVPAPTLFLQLVARDAIPASTLDDIKRFHWDAATIKVDWTLDGPIPWEAEPARQAATIHLADDLDAFTMASAHIASGQIPARPFLLVGQPRVADPTRAPRGKETAWAYTHVPRDVKGDAAGSLSGSWSESETDEFADRMENEIERLAPGFRDLIRKRHVWNPAALEAENPSLIGGSINSGTSQLHQQLVFRPTPGSLGRASTPVRGLFLGSSSAHPGGGVHGACGANAALAAIRADRVGRAFARLR